MNIDAVLRYLVRNHSSDFASFLSRNLAYGLFHR
jgi:hypothetical protein